MTLMVFYWKFQVSNADVMVATAQAQARVQAQVQAQARAQVLAPPPLPLPLPALNVVQAGYNTGTPATSISLPGQTGMTPTTGEEIHI